MEHFGSVFGLAILKGGAVAVALLCNRVAHPKFFHCINTVYVAMVGMNILTIIHGAR